MMGLVFWKPLISLWILYCIYDEVVVDGIKGGDTLMDLHTKTLIPALALILGHFPLEIGPIGDLAEVPISPAKHL